MANSVHNIDFFEKENARDLTIEQLVGTFVPTDTFRKLLTAKNHIVLGSRGSGKTSIAKMISHTHLSLYIDKESQEIIDDKKYIGIYVPMSTEWLGGVNNKKWRSEEEHDALFQWKLNVIISSAFIDAVKSCCDYYLKDKKEERVLREISIVSQLIEIWTPHKEDITNFEQLKKYLKIIDFEKQKQIVQERVSGVKCENIVGLEFETQLFSPLQLGIDIVAKELNFPDYTAWILCLDEAEILSVEQQKIINSYLRSFTGKLFFKIITMPYSHNTRDTNVGAPLNVGDDYDYLYIDHESPFFYELQRDEVPAPIIELFNKRVDASGEKYSGITIENLLGMSVLLDKRPWDFKSTSDDMRLFKKYASEPTLKRGFSKINNGELTDFDDQIGRKMKGMLYLKDAVVNSKGAKQLDIYSGTKMMIRCSDANPRKLIRLFKALLNKIPNIPLRKMEIPILTSVIQTQILLQFSDSALKRVQSEEKIGPKLYELINTIGNFMSDSIHKDKINTEQISSIKMPNDINDDLWNLIERAVDNGLIYPNIKRGGSTIMPFKNGEFYLAYALTPNFRLLPRKGVSRNLRSILKGEEEHINKTQLELF